MEGRHGGLVRPRKIIDKEDDGSFVGQVFQENVDRVQDAEAARFPIGRFGYRKVGEAAGEGGDDPGQLPQSLDVDPGKPRSIESRGQEGGEGRVGHLLLHLEGATLQDGGVLQSDAPDELPGESALPDPRLTFDQNEAVASCPDRLPLGEEFAEFPGPAHHRPDFPTLSNARHEARGLRPFPDPEGQGLNGVGRLEPQLVPKEVSKGFVGSERCRGISAERVQANQVLGGSLVQRRKFGPSDGPFQRLLPFSCCLGLAGQVGKQVDHAALVLGPPAVQPVAEVGVPVQREFVEEGEFMKLKGPTDVAGGEGLLQVPEVHLDPAAIQNEAVPFCPEEVAGRREGIPLFIQQRPEPAAKAKEALPERQPGAVRWTPRPEERRDLISADPLGRGPGHGQKGAFGAPQGHDATVGPRQAWRAQESESQHQRSRFATA